MNITLTLDGKLVKEVRKIAIERDTTLTGLVRDYLTKLAAENADGAKQERALEALEESFRKMNFSSRGQKWTRTELHERS